MQELLTYIVTSIVHHPDSVSVTQMESGDGQHVTLRLSVHSDDMGIIIGRDGNIARALRNIVKAQALKKNQKVYIDILESGSEPSESE